MYQPNFSPLVPDFTLSHEEDLETMRRDPDSLCAPLGTSDAELDVLIGSGIQETSSQVALEAAAQDAAREAAIAKVIHQGDFTKVFLRAVVRHAIGKQVGAAAGTLRNLFR